MWTNDEDDSDFLGDWDEDESDDDCDLDFVSCSACGELIYEDAPQCPHCGEYVTVSTSPWEGRHWIWIVLGVCGVFATVAALLA